MTKENIEQSILLPFYDDYIQFHVCAKNESDLAIRHVFIDPYTAKMVGKLGGRVVKSHAKKIKAL